MDTQQTHKLAAQLANTLAFVHESLSTAEEPIKPHDYEDVIYNEGLQEGISQGKDKYKNIEASRDALTIELVKAVDDCSILRREAASYHEQIKVLSKALDNPLPLEERPDYQEGYRRGNLDYQDGYRRGHLDGLGDLDKAKKEAFARGSESLLSQDSRVDVKYDEAKALLTTLIAQDPNKGYGAITVTKAYGTTVLAFIRKKDYITPKVAISLAADVPEMSACFETILNLPLLPYGAERK